MGLAPAAVLLLTAILCAAALTLPSHTLYKEEHLSESSISALRLNIKAKYPVYITFIPLGLYGAGYWSFGPVFTNDVLHEASRVIINAFMVVCIFFNLPRCLAFKIT